jgi:hypothetical protein
MSLKGKLSRESLPAGVWLTDRKCFKSAIFGDSDNLWEVLWYPNSGVGGGETASLMPAHTPRTRFRNQW